MPWPVYLALKQLFPTGRVSFFTLISFLGAGLGVALMLVASSVMGGFGHQIKQMIIDTQGEIQIKAKLPINDSKASEIEKVLKSAGNVTAFAPYASGAVMLEYEGRPVFPVIQGFNYEQMSRVIPLKRYLTDGSIDDLDDDSIILSYILANTLGVNVGDKVSVYSPLMMERIKRNEVLLPREVRVVGIFQIGHQHLDSSTVLCSLRLMQDLYGLRQAFHGYNVRLNPDANIEETAIALNRELPLGTRALTWLESNAEFQAVLSFERNIFIFLLAFIVVVAAFSMTGSLLMSVVRKTREIGLLSAMGGRARDVALCFCAQGLVIGIGGTLLGLAMGFTLLYFRDNIVHLIARLTMGQEVFERYYMFSSLPAHTETKDVVLLVVFSLSVSTLAGLIPAWRAARLKPVEALRSE